METSYIVHNRPPIKEIALAVALLVFGTLGIILGILMVYNRVGGDRAHGNFSNSLKQSKKYQKFFPPFSLCFLGSQTMV